MKTLLITGGAGFIGSNFAHYMYAKYPDYRIIVLDCLTYAGSVENLPVRIWEDHDQRLSFWYGDIANAELVGSLVAESEFIVHFAAESHVTRSIYDNTQFFKTDVLGTQTVANAVAKNSRKVERFIHISTSEVYGTSLSDKMDEGHPLNPMSPYASAKAGADRLVYSYHTSYGIPAVIVRPFNNFGPRQHLEKVVPRFVTSVLLGEALTLHGHGEAKRDFVFVRDNCRALDMILHAPAEKVVGEVFNVGTGMARSIQEIALDVARMMGNTGAKQEYIGDRPGQVDRHCADLSKIKTILGWQPQISWEDGLAETIRWYRENEAWWRKQLWLRKIPILTASGKREMH